MAKIKKSDSFKDMFDQLREINDWFMQEDIDLDEGLEKLKDGKTLIDQCRSRLKDVENQFEEILKDMDSDVENIEESDDEAVTTTEDVVRSKKAVKSLPF